MLYKIEFFDSPCNRLLADKLRVFLDNTHIYSEDKFEYLFVIGGDGSFIFFTKKYAFENRKIRVVGVKSNGTVAFLSSFDFSELQNIESREFLDVELLKIESDDEILYAFNDVYISGELFLNVKMYINDCYFQSYRGSGLLMSTKEGSTGKNKSLRGPVIFPETNVWVLSEIGAQTTNRFMSLGGSIVIPDSLSVKFLELISYRIYLDGRLVDLKSKQIKVSLVKGNSQILTKRIEVYIEKLKRTFLL